MWSSVCCRSRKVDSDQRPMIAWWLVPPTCYDVLYCEYDESHWRSWRISRRRAFVIGQRVDVSQSSSSSSPWSSRHPHPRIAGKPGTATISQCCSAVAHRCVLLRRTHSRNTDHKRASNWTFSQWPAFYRIMRQSHVTFSVSKLCESFIVTDPERWTCWLHVISSQLQY